MSDEHEDEEYEDDEDEDGEDGDLAPIIATALSELETSRKKLLRDSAFDSAKQLRAFIGTTLYVQIQQIVNLFGQAFQDMYGLGVQNAAQIQGLHGFAVKHFKKLGADLSPREAAELPGMDTAILDELQQAFYALASIVQAKLPGDKEAEEAFNRCAAAIAKLDEMITGGLDEEPEADESSPEPEAEAEKEPDA